MEQGGDKKNVPWRGRLLAESSIRYTVFLSFTITAVAAVAMTGFLLYVRFSRQLSSTTLQENQTLVEQINQSVDTLLRSMIRLSDSLCYSVIKNTDVQPGALDESFQLLHNINAGTVENIALFNASGELIATAPPAKLEVPPADVRRAAWFTNALGQTENLHVSTPAIQRLFADAEHRYRWVVSLSSAVEITSGKETSVGVLLIDMKYSAISEILESVKLANDGYVYLIDGSGEILYHPQQQLIASGRLAEDGGAVAKYADGAYSQSSEKNGARTVIVRSVGYTDWKIIGVIPHVGLTFDRLQNFLFIIVILLVCVEILILVNALVSSRLTAPIEKLESSVLALDYNDANAQIFSGGSLEVRRLSRSISQMVARMRELNTAMMREHEEKQKSELDTLQAQINPHFLYNTLDIIVWMIEKGQPGEAVKIVTALGRFFRISLSRGRNIISVRDEIAHVSNYLTIQQMRYKNKFRYEIDAAEETLELSTIKLVVQPLVENAIYHSMDFMDGDGLIRIATRLIDGDLVISVEDNGIGMPPERVETLLSEQPHTSQGSGIGLKNVHDRIRLYFGERYGVSIESEPDNGTRITLHLPAVPVDAVGKGGR